MFRISSLIWGLAAPYLTSQPAMLVHAIWPNEVAAGDFNRSSSRSAGTEIAGWVTAAECRENYLDACQAERISNYEDDRHGARWLASQNL